MPDVQLGAESIGIEHSVSGANNITGVASAGEYTWDTNRGVAAYPQLAGAGEGLIDVAAFKRNGNAYFTFAQILCSDTANWAVSITSGLRDGTATTVDNPDYDMELASGSGSSVVRINQELLSNQLIRFTVSGGTGGTRVIAMVARTNGSGGRLVS